MLLNTMPSTFYPKAPVFNLIQVPLVIGLTKGLEALSVVHP